MDIRKLWQELLGGQREFFCGFQGVNYRPLLALLLFVPLAVFAIAPAVESSGNSDTAVSHDHHSSGEHDEGGSPLSLFNHRFAGVGVILAGLSECRSAFGWVRFPWMRYLLPVGLLGIGAYLMILSDWEAWPNGSLTLWETLFEAEPDVRQHKLYAGLLLLVGAVELLRRTRRLRHLLWSVPLPAFAIFGGALLFLHVHGTSPIVTIHHSTMGGLAMAAGLSKGWGDIRRSAANPLAERPVPSRWDQAWAVFILIIGAQLLVYWE